jgi:glycosyltransferase involved in cell wall biosynthesis
MRILLIGNYIPDKQESMLRFASLMERELKAQGHSVGLLQPAPYLGRLLPVNRGLGKWLGYVDKFLLFPIKLRRAKNKYDVIHICDHSNAIYVKHVADKPHVVTCHDVLAIKSALGEIPQNKVSSTGRVFQRLILQGLKAAESIVCDSEATRTDVLRVAGRASDSTVVVYLSLNYPYSPMTRDEALARLDQHGFDGRDPFYVHVGGAQWYKNKLGVLQIFDHLRKLVTHKHPRLLMVGKPLSGALLEHVSASGLGGAVVTLSGVSNEDLRAAYSLAEGLIFPSLQEGFGWPVLEAQACGCPVFVTGQPPMTEVGGCGAVYFDPLDAAGAAKTIAEALGSREIIRQSGLKNISRFTVRQMIQGYVAAYERALSRRGIGESRIGKREIVLSPK